MGGNARGLGARKSKLSHGSCPNPNVFQLSIGAACRLIWPLDRLIVQVLDDSTDPTIMEMVSIECGKWATKGINIKCERRDNRNGYKAGALKQGMRHSYVKTCTYIAIFDADFQPEPDYLERTVPFLIHNPELALVQARWKFVNAKKCLMTRMQEMSLNYHFTAEQESGSTRHAFFGFNGTAGVWRLAAMEEAGGWKDRTTVEDMDLAVRVGLHGWKFVFVNDVSVKSELPSQFKAFRFQQHRCVFFPEVNIPTWSTVYFPFMITLFNAIATPRSFYLVIFWVLFENVMAMHRTKGTFIGLLEGGRVNEWVVTEKLGDALETKLLPQVRKPRNGVLDRINSKEMMVGIYILCCASYNLVFGKTVLYIYLYMQALAFIIAGIGFIGT
ncbi:unnamed protein product [Arabidopsis thaliana]|uniref:glucomannan 4-beta-mannosyltransferase n=1 Tax=Arabidopsis thaliana TaxID=3702 RepID=A0A7G2F8T5_ARATH|nr:unnamed protein product [Arabidopsis thaliana]